MSHLPQDHITHQLTVTIASANTWKDGNQPLQGNNLQIMSLVSYGFEIPKISDLEMY